MAVKIREESLPDAERERDEKIKARIPFRPFSCILLRNIEIADNRVERLKLELQEHEWAAYYLNRGEDDIPDEKKDWLREKRAKLAQRLARAKALDFDA